ncbi:MAG: deoxyribose-phosphate aldolase [Terriglobales bacterium]|jgi:deoxyribose-phosphate aldolase
MGLDYSYADVAKMIDHSLLNPTLTWEDLENGISLALAYGVASVCIMPYALKRCAERLRRGDSGQQQRSVRASTTIGFPHGVNATATKVAETRQALADGGEELDMVVNISKVLSGDWSYVAADIRAVVETTHTAGQKVKVIFENAYLNDDQKIRLCDLCGEVRADWVKTSTGYAPTGATDADLILMRQHSPAFVQVKAAGGIRDLDALLRIRAYGVTRCGATRTASMMDEARRRLGLPAIDLRGGS